MRWGGRTGGGGRQGRQTAARRTARAKVEAVWGTTLDSTDSPSRRCRCQSSGLVIVSVVEEEDAAKADEFERNALALFVSSNERHVGRLRGNRARVATTTDAMLTVDGETDGSERGVACLLLSLVVSCCCQSGGRWGRNPRGRGAGRADGFDVRQGGLGRDEEATSLAGGPVPPDTHTDTPTRTPYVGRRSVSRVLTRGRQALDRHACWLRSRGRWRASATTYPPPLLQHQQGRGLHK